jgi:hypothetical protein
MEGLKKNEEEQKHEAALAEEEESSSEEDSVVAAPSLQLLGTRIFSGQYLLLSSLSDSTPGPYED